MAKTVTKTETKGDGKPRRVAEGVYRRGDAYCVVLDVGADPKTGKRKQKWVTLPQGTTLAEAKTQRTDMLHKRDTGEFVVDSTKLTVAEYLGHWLRTYVATNCRPRTEYTYRYLTDRYIVPRLGTLKLVKLTAAHLREFYAVLQTEGAGDGDTRPLGPTSITMVHAVLHKPSLSGQRACLRQRIRRVPGAGHPAAGLPEGRPGGRRPRIRFHDLRNTHASLMLANNEHPKVVSERLGHSNVGITLNVYSHLLPGLQDAAASRLDALLRPQVPVAVGAR